MTIVEVYGKYFFIMRPKYCTADIDMPKATCLKEKKLIEIKNPHYEAMRNGGCIVKGTCPSCGGKVSVIVSVQTAPDNVKKQCLIYKTTYKRKKKGGSAGRRNSTSRPKRKSVSCKRRSHKK